MVLVTMATNLSTNIITPEHTPDTQDKMWGCMFRLHKTERSKHYLTRPPCLEFLSIDILKKQGKTYFLELFSLL